MMHLLTIEWRKLRHYRTFWIATGLYAAFVVLTFVSFSSLMVGPFELFNREAFKFPLVWQNATFLARFFNLYLAIVAIFLVTNEYSYRTLRQNVIDGLSRNQVVASKALVIGVLVLAAMLIMGATGMVLGLVNSKAVSTSNVLSRIDFLMAFGLHTWGLLSLAMLTGILLKRSGVAILVFLSYTIFGESIVRNLLGFDWVRYFPVRTFTTLNQYPQIEGIQEMTQLAKTYVPIENFILGLFYISLFHFFAFWLVRKADL